MPHALEDQKVAILVGNGFTQADMISAQKAFMKFGAYPRIVSSETGLVNGWQGLSWGHNFAIDTPLSTALGADFDVLVIPSGMRSLNKLKLTAHTRRFMSSFVAAGKPVIIFDDAVLLLALTEQARGIEVSGPAAHERALVAAGAIWQSSETVCVDGNIMTGVVNDDNRDGFISRMIAFAGNEEAVPETLDIIAA